ncbi:MAG: ECF transporter S component [Chloroflexota bacterium]
MRLRGRMTHQSWVWLAVLIIFSALLVLANRFTDGESFHGAVPTVVTALALLSLFGIHRATAASGAWRVSNRGIVGLSLGTGLFVLLAYVFNAILDISVGDLAVQPQVCVPILLGYAFGPVVGFFSGSVGSLLGDFVTGWGVFPASHIASGLTGLIPGLMCAIGREERNASLVSTIVVATIAVTAGIILVHPQAPEPWTGEVQSFRLWAWVLLIGGAVMVANSILLEDVGVHLAALNLYGTLGILAGHAFASLAHLWINEYGIASAFIGEFAPSAGTDIMNLVVFAPIILAAYNSVRRRSRRRARPTG